MKCPHCGEDCTPTADQLLVLLADALGKNPELFASITWVYITTIKGLLKEKTDTASDYLGAVANAYKEEASYTKAELKAIVEKLKGSSLENTEWYRKIMARLKKVK